MGPRAMTESGERRAAAAPSLEDGALPERASRRRLPPWLGEVALAALVVLVALTVRLVHLQYIENDFDAILKWWLVKDYLHGTPVERWNHHMARFAITVPTYLVQLVSGATPRSYFVLPVGMAVVQALLMFRVARRVTSAPVGVLAAILILAFPMMERSGSQLLPGVFSSTYGLLALHLMLRHADRPHARWLVLAGCALFLAYMSRLTAAYMFPGFVVAAFLQRRRWSDVFWLLLPMALLFAMETALYSLTTEYTFGRYSVITGHHFKTKPPEPMTLFSALKRYEDTDIYWKLVLFSLPVAAVTLLAFDRDRRRFTPIIVLASFLLLITFPVRGTSMVRAIRNHQRYFAEALPFALLVIAFWVHTVGRAALARWQSGVWGILRSRVERHALWFAAALAIGYGLVSLEAGWDKLGRRHPLAAVHRYARDFSLAYERRIPIVAKANDDKVLKEVRWLYLDDDLLTDQDGRFAAPSVRYVRVDGKRWAYLEGPSQGRVQEAVKKGTCVVELKRVANGQGGRALRIVRQELEEGCDRHERRRKRRK